MPLFDRLLDAPQGVPDAAPVSPNVVLDRLHVAVRRDLEALLNARRRRVPLPPLLGELPGSLLNYGIPDPASGAYATLERRQELARDIEATIRRFEPRLSKVRVVLAAHDDTTGGTLKLKVEAELNIDSVYEPVSFETLLEPVTREVRVRAA